MRRLASGIVLLIVALPALGWGQSLATVAKKEEERRKATTPGKVYTNGNLKADITTVPAADVRAADASNATPPAPDSAPEPDTRVPSVNLPAGNVESDTAVRNEAYWRSRVTAARSALERSRIFADALQSRLNALAADFVNRDDPIQKSQVDLERQRARAELERVNKEIAEQNKAITAIEEEARKAGVPPGWLR